MSSPIRVLVATMDSELLESTGFILIDAGYHVVLAWSGLVAQHRIETFRPTVIILDAMLQIGDQLAVSAVAVPGYADHCGSGFRVSTGHGDGIGGERLPSTAIGQIGAACLHRQI
jgi:hypothetical protein